MHYDACIMFEDIINQLIQSGMTESEIAAEVGSTQPSINRIRNGKQKPFYDLGAALVALRNKRLGLEQDKAAA